MRIVKHRLFGRTCRRKGRAQKEKIQSQFIKEELGNLIDTSNFYVALYDRRTDTFTLPFHEDEKDEFKTFPAGKTLTAHIIRTGKPLLANKKIIQELEQSGEIDLVGEPSEVWLGVPLFIKGEVNGAFAVQSYHDPEAFNESDMEMPP